jgi:hypothetical protein
MDKIFGEGAGVRLGPVAPVMAPEDQKRPGPESGTSLTCNFWSGRPDLNRRPLDPQNGGVGPSQLRGVQPAHTTGGHLRVVQPHGYRVVPKRSP